MAEVREPDAGEGPRARDAAALADELARPGQVSRLGGVPGELEREVAFDAGGKVAGRAVIHRPAAVVALVVADVLRDAAPVLLVSRPEKMREEQVLGVHRGVRFQLRPPVPLGVLFALEPPLGALDDEVDPRALDQDRKSTRLNSSHVAISYAV